MTEARSAGESLWGSLSLHVRRRAQTVTNGKFDPNLASESSERLQDLSAGYGS